MKTPEQRVRAVTLTAESIRLYNDKVSRRDGKTFAEWAEENAKTREDHTGRIKPDGEIVETMIWVKAYLSGMLGKDRVCPLDVQQMQDVLELADFTPDDFEANRVWGRLTDMAFVAAVDMGRRLYCKATGDPDWNLK